MIYYKPLFGMCSMLQLKIKNSQIGIIHSVLLYCWFGDRKDNWCEICTGPMGLYKFCTNYPEGFLFGLTSSKSHFIQPSVTLCVQVQLFSDKCQTVSVQPAIGVSSVTLSSNM